ncbi:hypothetical protein ACSLBF_18700 (plasmid) [Pseudoalteromonas sp. T1lg65]|uniref:hypothetical protein n=1 Tax=Pseudoalteromonas sp. T1lg65 TaxID=2077101 RepID=UPI003F7AA1BB
MEKVIKFLLSTVIVIVVFVISASAAGVLADIAGLWKKPIIGGVAAACVVISAYISAPTYKLIAATIWLCVGAIAAWVLSTVFMYAEDQATQLPLYITYASGAIALLLCFVWHKKCSLKPNVN